MVDRNPWLNILSHAVLIIGVAIVAFPLYLALIASTHGRCRGAVAHAAAAWR